MNDAGRLGGRGALLDGPGAGFLGAGGEVGLEAEGVEAYVGEGGEAGFFLAYGLEEFEGLLLVEFGEVGFQLGVEEDGLGGGDQGALCGLEVLVGQLVLVDVEDVEEGLGGEEVEVVEELLVAGAWTMPCEKRVSPFSRMALASSTALTFGATSFLMRDSFWRRGRTFSMVWRSARISSVLMVSMSSLGETLPSTWTTFSSLKARMTWQIASDSRMFARNLLPRPSPSERRGRCPRCRRSRRWPGGPSGSRRSRPAWRGGGRGRRRRRRWARWWRTGSWPPARRSWSGR